MQSLMLEDRSALAALRRSRELIYAVTVPYVALGLAYLYFDLRAREDAVEPTGGEPTSTSETGLTRQG